MDRPKTRAKRSADLWRVTRTYRSSNAFKRVDGFKTRSEEEKVSQRKMIRADSIEIEGAARRKESDEYLQLANGLDECLEEKRDFKRRLQKAPETSTLLESEPF